MYTATSMATHAKVFFRVLLLIQGIFLRDLGLGSRDEVGREEGEEGEKQGETKRGGQTVRRGKGSKKAKGKNTGGRGNASNECGLPKE